MLAYNIPHKLHLFK